MTHARGYTMIELIFYTAILTMLAIALVRIVLPLSNAFRTTTALSAVDSAAQVSLERMTRVIRGSTSVNLGGSTFNSSPGTLSLSTTDTNSNAQTVIFSLSGTTLRESIDGVDQGPLTPSASRITSLIFRHITTAKSHAVRIEMTLESGSGTFYQSRTFYSTVVLRGSYPLQ